jgi:hypothetical protein
MTSIVSRHQCLILHIGNDDGDIGSSRALEFLNQVALEVRCPIHSVFSKWIGPEILAEIMMQLKLLASDGDRSVLLISGHFLEDQVTVCCLESLMEGFDVHLLCDLISGRDALLVPALQQRLFQAGAVPSSMRQFLFLWNSAELDQNLATTLQNLQNRYNTFFPARPI